MALFSISYNINSTPILTGERNSESGGRCLDKDKDRARRVPDAVGATLAVVPDLNGDLMWTGVAMLMIWNMLVAF